MKTTNDKTPQTIESVKMDAMKVSHRYQLLLVAFAMLVLGTIGGYFLSIELITDAQAKAISVVTPASKK